MPVGRKGVLCLSTSTDDHGGPSISEPLGDPSADAFGATSDEDGTSETISRDMVEPYNRASPGRLLGGLPPI